MNERGGALLEVLTIGFVVVFLVVQAILTMARLQDAGETATEAAELAAVTAARTGDIASARDTASTLVPDADIHVERSGREYRAVVTVEVGLIGPGSGAVQRTVTGRATAAASPYRSGP